MTFLSTFYVLLVAVELAGLAWLSLWAIPKAKRLDRETRDMAAWTVEYVKRSRLEAELADLARSSGH